MLVLVPARVDGVPLTLNHMNKLVQAPRGGGHKTLLNKNSYKRILDQYGDVPCRESHWVLMTRDVLPGTRDKSFEDQCKIMDGFKTYQAPTFLEASVCILMEYVISGTRLFSEILWTYTRCQEKYGSYQITVGGFEVAGLNVRSWPHGNVRNGLAACRKF